MLWVVNGPLLIIAWWMCFSQHKNGLQKNNETVTQWKALLRTNWNVFGAKINNKWLVCLICNDGWADAFTCQRLWGGGALKLALI